MPLTVPNPPATGSRATALAAALRLWHLASFDAPTVAAVWSLGFAWVARVRLPLWVLALQVLVVWSVYVGDRLLDARTGLRRWGSALRERHFFHWRHRRILAPMAAVAACAAAAIALHWMPIGIRERDSVLAAASLAYFTRVHAGPADARAQARMRRLFSKELLVGILFTVGCALPAWSRAEWRALAVPVVFFAALAWLNCRAIERWESGQAGIARAAGWAVVVGGVAALGMISTEPRAAVLMAAGAASALLLAWLERTREQMTAVTLRAAADLVLLTPAWLLAAPWFVRR